MRKEICIIFGVLLVFTVLINPAFAIAPLDRIDITNPRLVNAFGSKILDQVNINQQVQISADIKNNQEKSQKFVYIVQIKNQNGVIVSLGWISGSLNPGQTFSPALSWVPKVSDVYTAEIFVWDVSDEASGKSWQKLDALAENITLKITS
ncbi:MAG: hypothetical protein ACREAK_01390 [Nitrosarchaeum sp.]